MNRPPLFLILQEELFGAASPLPVLETTGRPHAVFSARGDWRAHLRALDGEVEALPVVIFCSLQAAVFIRRNCPSLARGLLLDPEKMQAHRWSGILPQEMLLNQSFVLLPFGAIAARRNQIASLFGGAIFLRPNSGMKPFPGLRIAIEDLDQEISALRQIHHVGDDELCLIDRARDISGIEWRFWLGDGAIVTHAPYALAPQGRAPGAPPCPEAVLELAGKAARILEPYENPVVADIVLDENCVPRIVELNAFSTSGFYAGMSFARVIESLEELMG